MIIIDTILHNFIFYFFLFFYVFHFFIWGKREVLEMCLFSVLNNEKTRWITYDALLMTRHTSNRVNFIQKWPLKARSTLSD